jgi:hypothetical protein
LIEILETEETIKQAPHFGNKDELSPEFEDRVRTYFGLEPLHAARVGQRSGSTADFDRFAPDSRVDTEPGERAAEQRGAFLDDAPLDGDTARRDISRSEPRREPLREPRREPVAEPGQRANLDIPLDPPGGMPSSEPRRETVRQPVERSAERPVVRQSPRAASPPPAGVVPADQWEELDSTRGGVKVHRKRR